MAITRNLQTGDKFVDRGRICMLLGYAKDAPAGTYRFLHLKTKRVVVSRDVQWLGIMYKQHRARKSHEVSKNNQSIDDNVGKENPFVNNPYSPLVADDSDDNSDVEKNTPLHCTVLMTSTMTTITTTMRIPVRKGPMILEARLNVRTKYYHTINLRLEQPNHPTPMERVAVEYSFCQMPP